MRRLRPGLDFLKGVAAVATAFNANNWSGCLWWYDPSTTAGYTLNSSSQVSTCVDKSTGAVTGALTTAGSDSITITSINGVSAFQFTKNTGLTANFPSGSFSQLHLFFVCASDGLGTNYEEFIYAPGSTGSTLVELYVFNYANIGFQIGPTDEIDSAFPGVVANGRPFVVDFAIDTTAKTIVTTLTQGGYSKSVTKSLPHVVSTMGGNSLYMPYPGNGFSGSMGDMFAYSAIKNSTDAGAIRAALVSKWSLESLWMPAGLIFDVDSRYGMTTSAMADQTGLGNTLSLTNAGAITATDANFGGKPSILMPSNAYGLTPSTLTYGGVFTSIVVGSVTNASATIYYHLDNTTSTGHYDEIYNNVAYSFDINGASRSGANANISGGAGWAANPTGATGVTIVQSCDGTNAGHIARLNGTSIYATGTGATGDPGTTSYTGEAFAFGYPTAGIGGAAVRCLVWPRALTTAELSTVETHLRSLYAHY